MKNNQYLFERFLEDKCTYTLNQNFWNNLVRKLLLENEQDFLVFCTKQTFMMKCFLLLFNIKFILLLTYTISCNPIIKFSMVSTSSTNRGERFICRLRTKGKSTFT